MQKKLLSFKSSLLSGGIISLALLSFSFLLFFTLFLAQENEALTQIDESIISLLKFTLYQAFLSTLLSLMVGLLLAWSLNHQPRFKGRSLLIAIFSSSLVLPTLIVVFGLITVLGRQGWLNQASLFLFDHSFGSYLYGLLGILIAHVYLNASFASRSLLHALESIPKEKYKLAKSLNFTTFQRFRYVEFPAIKPTLLNIASTIFLLCFSSFAIVLILGGSPSYNTLEVAIYEAVKLDFDINMALKLALIQLSISSILVMFASTIRTQNSNLKLHHQISPWREKRSISYVQKSIIALFSLFFTLPLIAVFVDGMGADFSKILCQELFIKSLITSLLLATFSATLTLLFALSLGAFLRNFTLSTRLKNHVFSKLIHALGSFSGYLYLAIPSLILGLGFFLLSQKYELPTEVWSAIALITANILMSLPFALSILTPAMKNIAERYDKVSFSLGLTHTQRLFYVELPYLKSALGYIFSLSFCFSLGDLGVIALFGSDDFSTLPWYLYQLMGSYRNDDASGVALILLGITLFSFVVLPRVFMGKRKGI
jgi:thiamine transport system permease protein